MNKRENKAKKQGETKGEEGVDQKTTKGEGRLTKRQQKGEGGVDQKTTKRGGEESPKDNKNGRGDQKKTKIGG